jgi:hypothetical protein
MAVEPDHKLHTQTKAASLRMAIASRTFRNDVDRL